MNKKLYTLTLLLHTLCTLAAASEPYCNEKIPVYDLKPVDKTRTATVNSYKWFKKTTKTVTEKYSEQERYIKSWKEVTKCCEGYLMSYLNMCEPFCHRGCHKYASCVEPDQCQCKSGYISANNATDGSQYCEPMCKQHCPEHAHCSAPNICECNTGYAKDAQDPNNCQPQCNSGCPNGSCLQPEVCSCNIGFENIAGACQPVCQLGDGCRHGHCIEPEVCICVPGYQKNESSKNCEKIKCATGEGWDSVVQACVDLEIILTPVTENIEITTTTEAWETIVAVVASITSSAEKADMNDEITEATLSSSSPWQQVTAEPCAAGLIFFQGECHPERFLRDGNDCHLKACTAHAECLTNGSCLCLEGFVWHDNGSTCLNLSDLNDNSRGFNSDVGIPWLFLVMIAACVAVILVAIFFVGFKLMHRKRCGLNIVAENDLYCEYNNKSYYTEVQLVL